MTASGSRASILSRQVSTAIGLLVLCLCALVLAACSRQQAQPQAPPDDVLVRLSDDEVKSLDPQKVSDLTSLRVATDQFEGLTRYRGDGTVESGLAAGWSHDPQGLIWRFVLRRGLRFSDGVPITAETFVAVLERLRRGVTASPTAGLFDVIESMDAPESHVLTLTLRHPFPALTELLAHPAIAALPMHRIAEAGDRWTEDRPLVTSGPYQLQSWALHDRILLERNPNWHGAPAPIPAIEWKPAGDKQSAFRQFRAGQAHIVSDFPSERLDWLNRRMPGAAQVSAYRGSYYFVFNTRRPPFDDRRVRLALNLAVEREAITDRLLAVGNPPAWGVVPAGLSRQGGHRPDWSFWPRQKRLSEARHLLGEAGYGADRPLRFEIRFNSDSDHRRVALALLDNWRDLPVEARLLNTEATLHFASLRNGDFELARSGWIGDLSAPENFLSIYRGDSPLNYPGYRGAAFERLLEQALAISDPRQRDAAMAQAEAALMEDAPVLPVHYYVTKNLVGPRVTGWRNNLANVHPSRTLGLKGS